MVRIGAIRWLPVPSGPGDWPLSFLAVALRSEVGPRKRVVSSLSAWRIAGAVSVFTFLSSLSGVANATLYFFQTGDISYQDPQFAPTPGLYDEFGFILGATRPAVAATGS